MRQKAALGAVLAVLFFVAACAGANPQQQAMEALAAALFNCPDNELIALYNEANPPYNWLKPPTPEQEKIAAAAQERLSARLAEVYGGYFIAEAFADFRRNTLDGTLYHSLTQTYMQNLAVGGCVLRERQQSGDIEICFLDIQLALTDSYGRGSDIIIPARAYFNKENKITNFSVEDEGYWTLIRAAIPDTPSQGMINISERKPLPLVITTAEGEEVRYSVAWNRWRGGVSDRPGVFQLYADEYPNGEIPAAATGTWLDFEFLENLPDVAVLFEQSVREGNEFVLLQTEELSRNPVELNGNKWYYTLPTLAALPEDGQRYFVLVCQWQEKGMPCECEYGFIVRNCDPLNQP